MSHYQQIPLEPQIIVLAGATGSGKSTHACQLARAFALHHKGGYVVFDPEYSNPHLSFPFPADLRREGRTRHYPKGSEQEIKATMFPAGTPMRHAAVILDDCLESFRDFTTRSAFAEIGRRHRKNDLMVILTVHGLGDINSQMWKFANRVLFFRSSEPWGQVKARVPSGITESAWNQINHLPKYSYVQKDLNT